ncbi:hypothetical protein [Aliidongia dinghuensis]|nr:hypothetical protein [Aliidongia dinghuensis]
MHDLWADWQKWSLYERASAVIGLSFLTALVPAFVAAALLPH